ncbi:Piso0_000384 [Millerozyma farinosa CBS 7064]|uniref:FACT complex subunit n=1 Tax=Pichia sorbitophila (strain ATCC MYA-4447 / BCRC 22081 / CBS 7064 / NBRC 10061 / NRRL Y-12695) TaxID=559304 RepID=G8YTV0_PICSO|nr:Piso0_000384 [Millerozyma farinosa CBS 7064]CCE73351.1 Piso0_000384 [Millerozyma farinosa CBS 7064]
MSEVKIDSSAFHKRLSVIQRNLAADKDKFGGLLFLVGGSDDENTYKKSTVLQVWLLGYEFVHTGIYITQDKCIFITSEGKAKYLTTLTSKPTVNSSDVEIWPRLKDAEKNKESLSKLVELLKIDGQEPKAIGRISKDKYKGKLIDEWNEMTANEKLNFADCSQFLSYAMEIKDADELASARVAAKSSTVMMDVFANEMMVIVDEERKTSHLQLSEKIEDKIDSNKWYTKSALGKKLLVPDKEFDPSYLDWCYSPIVQSGGEYDLRPSAQSNNKRLVGDGVIISSLGLRYKSYCSNIARTFFVDPTEEMEQNYEFLLKLQNHIVYELLKPGTEGSKVYSGALDFINKEKPDLAQHFTKNCGWLMGIEFRDSTFVLNAKSERKIQNGQVFSITIGLNNLTNSKTEDPKLKNYSLLLSDTFRVGEQEPSLLTTYSTARAENSFYFKEDTQVKAENDKKLKSEKDIKIEKNLANNEANSKILKSKLRHEQSESDTNNAEKIRQEIQSKLHEKRQQEGLARFSQADATEESELQPVFKKYDSYVRESQIPSNVRDLKIHVDYKNQTIILPISGRPVPFHINAFKNGSQNEEGEFTYLRLNFNSPGAGGNASRKAELPYEDSPENSFLRSITLRSRDRQRMVDVYKAIQDLKKDAVKREQEKKQMADVVTQANLVELKGSRVKRLENVFVRPTPDTKKIGGVLQIHENGLRYQSVVRSDQRVDVLFSNIKHLFFQPCKDELIVLIHCHLKSPIMIGKRKTHDVQFYREASDMAFDETGGRRRKYRYGDEDELQQEQEERRRKALLDKEFKAFAEVIADSSNGFVDLDIPFRELGFQGVPFRSAVFCMPTRDCLVQLIDPPYLVITLEEIEIAHLERVQFGLKNFDLVFVFKDFNRPVVHINTIPMEVLEDVKSWLTDVDIPISEGRMNLNWTPIMKTIQSDPYQFFVNGGWNFLTGEGDSSDEDEEEEESEFEVSDENPSDEDVASEESAYSEASSDSEGSYEEESDNGDDWDELERKAANEDKQLSMI